MTGLPTSELTKMRAVQADYMPDTCTIQTKTVANNAIGEPAETWANTYTSVSCRLMPVMVQDRKAEVAQAIRVASTWILTVAHNQTIDTDCRVVHSSKTYHVVSLDDTHSYRTAKRATLERID